MGKRIAKRISRADVTSGLPVARKQLALADDIPDIASIAKHAEAVRAAARSLEVSVPGINAWTIFQVEAERKGADRIEAMRKAGELADTAGRPKRNSPDCGLLWLPDLISSRARQRANEWEMLRQLGIDEIATIEHEHNVRMQLVSHSKLIKLGAAKFTEKRRLDSRSATPLPDGMELRIGDCRIVLVDVPDNSVPLILTDPPYGDEAEPLYQWLAQWAARVLIPGGSLICYTGQSRLDRDLALLSAHLRYWWLLVMPHDQSQRLPGKFVIANFKPVLWYVKEFRRGRSLMPDMLRSPAREKEMHNWAQGEGGVSQIIEHLTLAAELIVDPFAGTAKWGHIANAMGRRWLGADVIKGGATEVVATNNQREFDECVLGPSAQRVIKS